MPPPPHPPESAFTFLAQGALIQEFNVAGHNIVLGFPEASFYKTHNAPYFGETIGRTTNRIRDAKLHNLNGQTYRLAANDGPNCLHGGSQGWGKKDFEGPKPVNRHGKEGVEFRYVSKHMEEGYPGTVECKVWYMGSMEDGKTVLEVEYQVTFIGDECNETVVGVTNHRYAPPLPSLTSNPHAANPPLPNPSYFNLNPTSPTVDGTIATLHTNQHLVLDANSIPTGAIAPHPSAPPTPNTPFPLTATTPSFDDCMVVSPSATATIPLDTRPLPLRPLVTLSHPATGLHLRVESTEPAFQFYTGEHVDVPEVVDSKGGVVRARGPRSGIAVEPSRYVDCAGREEWRGQCRVRRGEVWGARSVYLGWVE